MSDRYDEMGLELARTAAAHGYLMPRALASWVADLVRREVEQYQRDAEKYRWCIAHAAWHRSEGLAHVAISVAYDSDLSCYATRDIAIEAAIRARGGA